MPGFLPNLNYLRLSKKEAFKKAIESGDLKKVRSLLNGGLDANTSIYDDDAYHMLDSPLVRALRATDDARDRDESNHTKKAEKYYEIIELLIKHGAIISQNTNLSCTIRISAHTSRHYITLKDELDEGMYGFSLDEKISPKISKLLINNLKVKCDYSLASPEQAIADIYVPSALKYVDLINSNPKSTANVLSDDISRGFFKKFLQPELKSAIMKKFNVSEESADQIIKLLFENIQKLTSDEIAAETKFLKAAPDAILASIASPSNPKLVETVFASITNPIRTANAIADNVRGANVKAAFIADHAATICDQQFEAFTSDNRKKLKEWSTKIVDAYKNCKDSEKLTADDLKLVFTVFVNLATNNKDAATQATRMASNKKLATVLKAIINPQRRSLFKN